jgi:proline iminopeptidase
VSELVLWGVGTTSPHEMARFTWSLGEVYPEAFAELRSLVPDLEPGGNLPAASHRLPMGGDPDTRDRAARAWCAWKERIATRGAGRHAPVVRGKVLGSRVRNRRYSLCE